MCVINLHIHIHIDIHIDAVHWTQSHSQPPSTSIDLSRHFLPSLLFLVPYPVLSPSLFRFPASSLYDAGFIANTPYVQKYLFMLAAMFR